MNKVFLLGRLTADPEPRQTQNNISVASFTVAVNRPFTKGAERQADFIDCVAWRAQADFLCKYFTKGKPILVEGRLQARSYEDKQGIKRRTTEVICDNVSFVEGSKSEGKSIDAPEPADTGSFTDAPQDSYDDLPFN